MRATNGWVNSDDHVVSKGIDELIVGNTALEHMNRRLKAYMSLSSAHGELSWAQPRTSVGDFGRISYFSKQLPRTTAKTDWDSRGLRSRASKTQDSIDGVEGRLNEIKQENDTFQRMNGTYDNYLEQGMRRPHRRMSSSPDITVNEPEARSHRSYKPQPSHHTLDRETRSQQQFYEPEENQDLGEARHAPGCRPETTEGNHALPTLQGMEPKPSNSSLHSAPKPASISDQVAAAQKKKLLKQLEEQYETHLKEKDDLLSIIENQKVLIEHFKELKPQISNQDLHYPRARGTQTTSQLLQEQLLPAIRVATSSSRFSNDGEMAVKHLQGVFPESNPSNERKPSPHAPSVRSQNHDRESQMGNIPHLKVPEPSYRTNSHLQTAGSGSIKETTLKVPSQSAIKQTPKGRPVKKKTRIEGDKVIAIGGPRDLAEPKSRSKISISQSQSKSRSKSKRQTPSPSPPLPPKGCSAKPTPLQFERLKRLRKQIESRTKSKDKPINHSPNSKVSRNRTVSKSPKKLSKDKQVSKDNKACKAIPRPSNRSVDSILQHTSRRLSPKLLTKIASSSGRATKGREYPGAFGSGALTTPGLLKEHGLDSFDKGLLAYCFAKRQVAPEYKKKVDVFVDRLADYLRARALKPTAAQVVQDLEGPSHSGHNTSGMAFAAAVAGLPPTRVRGSSGRSRSESPAPGKLLARRKVPTANPLQRVAANPLPSQNSRK